MLQLKMLWEDRPIRRRRPNRQRPNPLLLLPQVQTREAEAARAYLHGVAQWRITEGRMSHTSSYIILHHISTLNLSLTVATFGPTHGGARLILLEV